MEQLRLSFMDKQWEKQNYLPVLLKLSIKCSNPQFHNVWCEIFAVVGLCARVHIKPSKRRIYPFTRFYCYGAIIFGERPFPALFRIFIAISFFVRSLKKQNHQEQKQQMNDSDVNFHRKGQILNSVSNRHGRSHEDSLISETTIDTYAT